MVDEFLSAAHLGLVETLVGPTAFLPSHFAVVVVAAAWIGWVDLRHGIIPDLALGVLVGIALARLAPYGASAMMGGVIVGVCAVAGLSVLSHIASGLNRASGVHAGDGGVGRLGSGDIRFVASCTMLLGMQGTVIVLTVAAVLVAGHAGAQMRYAGRPLRDALLLPVRLGPPLAAFIHQGGERSGRRVEMINVGLHRRASSAAALTAA